MKKKSLKIGKLKLKSNLVAAPLAGFSDLAWRIMAIHGGAGAVFSEMVSVEGLRRNQKKTYDYVVNDRRARPFGIQLFGVDPNAFAESFDVLKDAEFDLIDINAGCPVKKVVSHGCGSALMKTPEKIKGIIQAIRSKYKGALTIKIRAGWDQKKINAVEIAKISEGEGVDAVIVHPRTKEQGFTGHSDWKIIAEVKSAVKIPVIGNGDVVDGKSAKKLLDETGCDGIMIGRAALYNPMIFSMIYNDDEPSLKDRIKMLERHALLLTELEDPRYTITMLKKFVPRYLKGIQGCKELSVKIYGSKTVKEALDGIEAFKHFHNL